MAHEFYVTITGKKQGKFKGETTGPGQRKSQDRIPGIRFAFEVISPRDPASGLPTGKRQHLPVAITKEWGAASPQIFQALVTNEVLSTVLFEFVKTDASGKEFVHYRIKLTDASISDVRAYLDLTDTSGDRYDARELEDVAFTYRKIEIENLEAQTTASDDWTGP